MSDGMNMSKAGIVPNVQPQKMIKGGLKMLVRVMSALESSRPCLYLEFLMANISMRVKRRSKNLTLSIVVSAVASLFGLVALLEAIESFRVMREHTVQRELIAIAMCSTDIQLYNLGMQERKNMIAVGSATIKDLAPEEKEKVGELIRRLAQEKALREEFEKKYEEIKQKYEQLAAKYNAQVSKAQDENRFLKLELKNSLRKLQQSTQHIRQRRMGQPSLTESNPNLRKEMPPIKQPELKQPKQSPLSKPRTSSRRKEIQELKQQIESLSKGHKTINNPIPVSPPKPIKQSKLQQYELIKSRYQNKTMIDDSFQASPEQPETPTLPEPMTFVKPNQINVTRVQTSIFEDNQHYSTQKATKRMEQPIVQTVKKVAETVKSRQASRICRQGFYSSDLLDLVDSLDK